MINVGDKVRSKTPAGLWLANVPADGTYDQDRQSVCTMKTGVVLEVQDIVIDYDSWPDADPYDKLGLVPFRNVLVQGENGTGWAGAGALIKDTQQLTLREPSP